MPTKDEDEQVIRPFADFLREHDKGLTHDDLSLALHKLIAGVEDTGKKGTLTYTITVSRLEKGGDMLRVSDAIRLKAPEHDRPTAIYFTDADGNLSRNDPNQLAFESLRALPPAEFIDPTDGKTRKDTATS